MASPHERLGRSRGSVDRAGQLLREWYESGLLAGPEVEEASVVLNDYRSQIKDPLKKVVMAFDRQSGRPEPRSSCRNV